MEGIIMEWFPAAGGVPIGIQTPTWCSGGKNPKRNKFEVSFLCFFFFNWVLHFLI